MVSIESSTEIPHRLALRTRAPRCEHDKEVTDVDIAIAVEFRDVAEIWPPCGEEGEQVGNEVYRAITAGGIPRDNQPAPQYQP